MSILLLLLLLIHSFPKMAKSKKEEIPNMKRVIKRSKGGCSGISFNSVYILVILIKIFYF